MRAISQEFLIGKILFELIEADQESIFSDSIKQRGEGVSEIIFLVSDLSKEIDQLENKGTKILFISSDKKMASVASHSKGNILTRLIQKG